MCAQVRDQRVAEEREQQIASARRARRARRKDLRPARPLEPGALLDDLRSERPLTRAELRDLAARAYAQPVVSLYLNLAPDAVATSIAGRQSLFNSLRRGEEAARRYLIDGLSPGEKARLERDLEELELLAQSDSLGGARCLVAFKSGDQLARAEGLRVKVRDSLAIDLDPRLGPLEAVLEAHPPALVAVVHSDRAELWSYRLERLEEVDRIRSFVPSDAVDRSREAKAQRHRLTHKGWHLKTVAQTVTRLLDAEPEALLVLAGDEDVLPELEPHLPKRSAPRLAGRLPFRAGAERADWERDVEEVLRLHRSSVEAAAVAAIGDFKGAGRLFSGLPDVLEKANLFQLRELYVDAELSRPGRLCREHQFLALEAGECPYDGAPLLPVGDVVDELIEHASLHGVDLMVVGERRDLLEPYAGIAGVTIPLSPS